MYSVAHLDRMTPEQRATEMDVWNKVLNMPEGLGSPSVETLAVADLCVAQLEAYEHYLKEFEL